jgi:hypothetical protein
VNRYFQDPTEDEPRCRFNPFLDALLREFPPEKINPVLAHPANHEVYIASSFTEKDGPIQLARNMCSNIELQSLLLSFSSTGSAGNEVWTVWVIVERKNPPQEEQSLTLYESPPTARRPAVKKEKPSLQKSLIKPDPEDSGREAFTKPDSELTALRRLTKIDPPPNQVTLPYRK